MSRIVYKLNGQNLNELGIIVKSADGLIDLPELKKRAEFDWADMHGKIIDTRRPYFEPRTITLDCAWPIEPRGRNLLAMSQFSFSQTTSSFNRGLVATYEGDGWIRVVGTLASGSYNEIGAVLKTYTEETAVAKDGIYTASVEGGEGVLENGIGIAFRQQYNGGTTYKTTETVNTTNKVKVFDLNGVYIARVCLYASSNLSGVAVNGRFRIKLEKGTIPTDWSPAPEDLGLDAATEGGTFNIQTAEKMIRENLLALGQQVRLEVHFDSKILVKPLIFNVIQDKGITFGRKFSGADVLLFFKITLIEPQPCKIVLESKKTRGSYTRATSSIGFTPNGAVFDVDWGDGSTVYDIGSGSTLPITHTYSGDGTFYVIISGDVAAITNLTKSNDFAELWTLK